VENHGYGDTHDALSHHRATLDGYAQKARLHDGRQRPVDFLLGRHGNNHSTIRRGPWAITLAGGSFTWIDLPGCGGEGERSSDIFAGQADEYLDVLYDVMTGDVAFHAMNPHDELLSDCSESCLCLAEIASQYLVFTESGESFSLQLESGSYTGTWIDTKTNERRPCKRRHHHGGWLGYGLHAAR